jgi:MoaA/NifB/PqqE/SkfB family radical SAM enzyme
MLRLEANFLDHALRAAIGRPTPRRPLLAYIYVTYRCNLRCCYCDDGTGVAYPERPPVRELDTDEMLRLLTIIRRETDGVVFTGGEPLMRLDLEAVLDGARRMGFRTIALLTNGFTLHERPGLLDRVSILTISLDTLDPGRGRELYRARGVTERVVENVEHVIGQQRTRGFALYLSLTITPRNLSDAHTVIDFAVARRVGIMPTPALVGRSLPAALHRSAEYQALIVRLMRLKRGGYPVLGTMAYLRRLRDLAPFRCLPTLLARIRPDGRLLYPCNKINLEGGDLLALGDYNAAGDEARARHGERLTCDASCAEGCYMDFSLVVQRPSLLLEEAFYRCKSFVVHDLLGRSPAERAVR